MLTQDEFRKKRWEKELRRKQIRKGKRQQRASELRGFQKGHLGYWKGKKLSQAHKKEIRDAKVGIKFDKKHRLNLKLAISKFWQRIKGD